MIEGEREISPVVESGIYFSCHLRKWQENGKINLMNNIIAIFLVFMDEALIFTESMLC